MLAAAAALSLEVSRGATVPGASDNATGVAAVLELVRRFAADPPPGTEVIAVLPGAEEAGHGRDGGVAAPRSALDPATTLVLGLDTLGAGEPMVLHRRGPAVAGALPRAGPRPGRCRRAARRARAAAALSASAAGPTRCWPASRACPAISMLSLRGNAFNDYHRLTDTPDRVDWNSVNDCLTIAEGTARTFACA